MTLKIILWHNKNTIMKKYAVRDREAGNIIEFVNSIEEGQNLIEQYERTDRENDVYTPDFYEVAELC
jgi:hypothetical protein